MHKDSERRVQYKIKEVLFLLLSRILSYQKIAKGECNGK